MWRKRGGKQGSRDLIHAVFFLRIPVSGLLQPSSFGKLPGCVPFALQPGGALNTFGKVIHAGVEKVATPGACTVMSKVCCSNPGGSMSRTSSGGTTLMPTWPVCIGWPSTPTRLFDGTEMVRY